MAQAYPMYPQPRGSSITILIIYLLFAAYFINFAFNLIKIPSAIEPLNKWIIFIGGLLLVWGAINHYRVGQNPY